MPTREELRDFDRQLKEKLLREKRPNVFARCAAGIHATFSRAWSLLDPVAAPIIGAISWVTTRLARLAWGTIVVVSCKKDSSGARHFDARHCLFNLVKIGLIAGILTLIATPAYYYGTWTTYRDVYVPSAGVFVNEQFVHPSGAGQVIAPRDEIYTVLGRIVENDGRVEPIRFDIDSNLLFFFYNDAVRPDLAAAKLDSQSPYGVKCTVETTGLYNRLPRYVRIWALKWWDMRPEIVRVVSVEELKSVPPGL